VRVLWTLEASQDREDIWNYIAADNPHAAADMDELFSNAALKLAIYPMLGRLGKVPGTRELVPHENYLLIYEIVQETVWILALIHAARQWPPVRD
jgi:addiction module RelE/StbE family toxin